MSEPARIENVVDVEHGSSLQGNVFEQTTLFDLELASSAIAPADATTTEGSVAEPRDVSQMRFSYKGSGAATLLRASFDGRQYWAASAVYDALLDLCNDYAAQVHRPASTFPAHRDEIAAYAGVGLRTVDFYVEKLEELRLLKKEPARGGRRRVRMLTDDQRIRRAPNAWTLLQVAGDSRGAANDTPNDSRGAAGCASKGPRGAAPRAPVVKKKDLKEGNVIPGPWGPRGNDPLAGIER